MPEEDDSITRPFLKARKRFCEATSFDDQRDELGHMLDELFRMIELRGGVARLEKNPAAAPTALAVILFRHKRTHETTRPGAQGDVFTDFFTNMFGSLIWDAPDAVLHDGRYGKYNTSSVVGKPCLDTVNRAFDEVSMLPPI